MANNDLERPISTYVPKKEIDEETLLEMIKQSNIDFSALSNFKEGVQYTQPDNSEKTEYKEKVNTESKNYQYDIDAMNKHFYSIYIKVLSPELKKNEDLKRRQKPELMKNIFKLIKGQFIATYAILFMLIVVVAISHILQISDSSIKLIFSFMKFYTTSIVAELIVILFFIVRNIFDKSIYDLFKDFDKRK